VEFEHGLRDDRSDDGQSGNGDVHDVDPGDGNRRDYSGVLG
jgi:hypothetical protein